MRLGEPDSLADLALGCLAACAYVGHGVTRLHGGQFGLSGEYECIYLTLTNACCAGLVLFFCI
jgi:hypothetical protein